MNAAAIMDEAEYEDVYEGEEHEDDSEYTDASEDEDQESLESASGARTGVVTSLMHRIRRCCRWPSTSAFSWGRLRSRMSTVVSFAGNAAWIFTTSMLLIGLPVLFAYDREKALQEQQLLGLPAIAPK